jgi:hypothetical protein
MCPNRTRKYHARYGEIRAPNGEIEAPDGEAVPNGGGQPDPLARLANGEAAQMVATLNGRPGGEQSPMVKISVEQPPCVQPPAMRSVVVGSGEAVVGYWCSSVATVVRQWCSSGAAVVSKSLCGTVEVVRMVHRRDGAANLVYGWCIVGMVPSKW